MTQDSSVSHWGDNSPTLPTSQTLPMSGKTGRAPDSVESPSRAPKRAGLRWPPTRKQWFLLGGCLVALLLIAGVATYFTVSAQVTALLAANDFCTAMKEQDYPKAYGYFAVPLRQQVPQAAFEYISGKGDALQGKVMGCAVSGVDVAFGGQAVTIHSMFTRAIIGPQKTDLHMVHWSGSWKIDQSPDPLLLPMTAAYFFCDDVRSQNYDAAYGILSPDLQRQVSRGAFTTISTGSDTLYGKVTDCGNVSAVEINSAHTMVVVHSTLVREKQTKPSDLHIGLIADHWKVSESPDPLLLPLTAAYNFCEGLKAQNYPAAYGYFGSPVRAQVPQNAFTSISQGSDKLYGTVSSCTVTAVDAAPDLSAITVHSSVVRTQRTQPGDLHLVMENGAWRIDRSPDPLLVPLVTAYNFCEGFKRQDYSLAYEQLAPAVQQQIPSDAFTSISQGGDTLQGKVTDCNVTSVAMSAHGALVTVQSTLVRVKQSQPGTLLLAPENGQWKISQSPDPLLIPMVTAYSFCQDMKSQSYLPAYSLLGTALRGQVTQDAFTTILAGADTLQGKVLGCDVTGVQMSPDNASVKVQSTTMRATTGGQPSTLNLVQENGRWVIKDSPDPLIMPMATAYYFCQDLKAKDYSSAFHLMSSGAQSKLGAPLALQLAIGTAQVVTGSLTGCQVNGYQFSSDKLALTVKSLLAFTRSSPLSSTLNLVQEQGAWRVDKLTMTILGIPTSIPAF